MRKCAFWLSLLVIGAFGLPAPAVLRDGRPPVVARTAAVSLMPVADPAVEDPARVAFVGGPPATVEEPDLAADSTNGSVAAPAADPQPPGPGAVCAEARDWVESAGLVLPPGVEYHCPSTEFAHHGAACWYGAPCPGGGFVAVNLELMAGPTTAYVHHVVAHEFCHILQWQQTGATSEARADACAAAHGAP
jgi:hypothetical protein